MDDGVDVLDRHDLADDGGADVGTHELDPAQLTHRGPQVETDHAVDAERLASLGEVAREERAERAGDTRDQDDAAHGPYLPSLRRWTRVRLSILRCFFFDIRLRRFLMTEPTGDPLHDGGGQKPPV